MRYVVFNQKGGVGKSIIGTPWEGLHIMPSSALLEELHCKLESRSKIYKLRDALAELARLR
jgi:chromosome partitioning protein